MLLAVAYVVLVRGGDGEPDASKYEPEDKVRADH